MKSGLLIILALVVTACCEDGKPCSSRVINPIERQWLDADMRDIGSSMTDGRNQYTAKEVSPGKAQWVENVEAEKLIQEMEDNKRKLWWALRSRVLTDQEMEEVEQYGDSLNIENGVSYGEEEKQKELNEALAQQLRLRTIANRKSVN